MRLLFVICITTTFLFLTGCNANNVLDQNNTTIDQLDPQTDRSPRNNELDKQLGFVRSTKDEYDRRLGNGQVATMDRMEMASIINEVILQTDSFIEVATLVTDKEVLIAYERSEDVSEAQAADIAKKTAQSVMPRYFDVHVSDNVYLIQEIQSLHNSTTENKYYKNIVDKIINEMQKSPRDR